MQSKAVPIALILTALVTGCTPSPPSPVNPPAAATSAPTTTSPAPASDQPSPHLSGLARLVGGEWTMVTSGTSTMRDRWTWGVGNQSLRLLTHGASAAGDPWRAIQTIYWHPIHKQLRILGFNPFSESVEDGTLTITPDGTQAIYDLYQVRNRRVILQRRTFTTPDRKHVELLEGSTRGDAESTFKPLVAWDYTRTAADQPIPPLSQAQTPPFPARLAPLEFLHSRIWQSVNTPSGAWAASTRIAVEWIPYADILTARIESTDKTGSWAPLADLTVYRHTGTGNLRGFAISRTGDVYEGDLIANPDGSIDGTLTVASTSGSAPLQIRLNRDAGGAAGVGGVGGVVGGFRLQIWSITAGERTLLFDARHEPNPA